ncbi:phenylalanine 4-monooxygenase [Streptomyces sp. CBMA152]|uniref:phenylalanine 4-monooxygenase n=1 Tax=Streptomyces sp. CBMA152 TaxID=1896312 RepID=UPI0016618373|nr:phenylalanine 4-monooxygenase [Streptomyces sp. CBMA152]MBD0746158.1 phenylalanine 4-monooxygenase [Streptomyces sp. CBMA152]
MSQQTRLFAPVNADSERTPVIEFPPGHAGYGDEVYQARRTVMAEAALNHRPGDEPPHITYAVQDHMCWDHISRALTPLWRTYATAEVQEALENLALPTGHVPQLSKVSRRLETLTGFTFSPAAGIVPLERFYGSLADSTFHSTQFIRHHSRPLFSPEPDMVHEVMGHGATLASPRFADLYRKVGAAARRAETRESLKAVSRIFWFTLEYGLLGEADSAEVYGASLLSSYGELHAFRGVEIRSLDVRQMATQPYDVTEYQPVLFTARSLNELEDFLGGFLSDVDGDTGARLGVTADQRW